MTGITVIRADGRLRAVKRVDADRAERLRHEAAVLERVDHPGLVQIVELTDTTPIELHTLFAGPDSWDRRPPDGDRAVVGGLAAVAAIMADLHELDTTHGSIDASHVITSADGRPVLCGLGDSGVADEAGRRTDLDGFAALIDQIGGPTGGEIGRRLGSIAGACRNGSIDARTLARNLDALDPREPATSRPSSRAFVLSGMALAVVAAVGWTVTRTAPTTTPTTAPTTTAPTTTAPTTTAPTTTAPTTTAAPPSTAVDTASVSRGDPLPGPTDLAAAEDASAQPELVHDGRRYAVGRDGDLVVVGDWSCDGLHTPAVLRPATGTIAVFGSWPAEGRTVEPVHVTTVIGARRLDVETANECDQIRVRTTTGSQLIDLREDP